jgi:type IV pilus biogenesis protein PilP
MHVGAVRFPPAWALIRPVLQFGARCASWLVAVAVVGFSGAAGAQPQQVLGPADVTVDTLIKLRQAELQEQINQRIRQMLPAPVAPANETGRPVVPAEVLLVAQPQPAPAPTKRVAAIYGRLGQEVADIELPGGQMLRVSSGELVDGWHVIRVTAKAVEVRGVPWMPPLESGTSRRSTARGASAGGVGHPMLPVRLTVPLGGTFH